MLSFMVLQGDFDPDSALVLPCGEDHSECWCRQIGWSDCPGPRERRWEGFLEGIGVVVCSGHTKHVHKHHGEYRLSV